MTEGRVSVDLADWWINKAFTYGLAFVFTACVLGILIWIAVVVVGILRTWMPRWFESQIEMQEELCRTVKKVADGIDCVHTEAHATREGLRHTSRALRAYMRRNKARLKLPSDVMVHFDNATEALESSANHRHGEVEDDWRADPESEQPGQDPAA